MLGNGIELFFGIIPVIVALAAVQFFLYELTRGVISAVLWQFITAVLGCYVAGCFYPSTFFPEAVQYLAKYLPQGAVLRYMQAYQKKTEYGSTLFVLFFYMAVCICMTILVRIRRVEGNS